MTAWKLKRKQKSESLEDKEKTKGDSSAQPISDQVDVDKDTVLSRELVVTKLVFALIAKLPDQAQYNVSKLYYENFLGQGKMKDYFKIINNQAKIFSLQDNKLSLKEDWLKHFVLLGENMKVSSNQVSWSSTSQQPTVEVSKKKSGTDTISNLPQSISIKNIPVVLHLISNNDPQFQHLDMRLGGGKNGSIHTFVKNRQLHYNTGTVALILHLNSVLKKSCIEFAVSNGKKLDMQQEEHEKGTRETESSILGKYTVASSEQEFSSPEDLAALELIFRILSSGPVSKDDLHSKHNLSIERTPQLWEVDGGGLVGLAPSWVENILHFALNATEAESKYSGKTTEATAKITSNKKGNPNKLIINDITAVVMNKEDWPVERVVFRLREQGPTFSAKCPSKLRKDMSTRVREYSSTGVLEYYLSSPIIIRLSVNLKKVSTSSQIKVNVTNKAPQEPARKKEISERQSCSSRAEVSFQSNKKKEREPSNKQSKKAKGMQRNTPKEVAAVELIIRTITTGPVCKDGTWKPTDLSSIENILHLALNVTETGYNYSGKTTEAMARITSDEKGNPNRLIIDGITAVVENKEDLAVERVVFKLREPGPTFSAKCPSKLRKYSSSPIIIRLSVKLKKVLTSSQITVKVTNKAPQELANKQNKNKERKVSVVKFENQESNLQEDAGDIFISREFIASSEEDAEEFFSTTVSQVVTIGNEDGNQERGGDQRGGGHEESREADPKEASQRPRLKLLPRTVKDPAR